MNQEYKMIPGIMIFIFVLFLFITLFMSLSGYFMFLLVVCFLFINLLSVIVSFKAIMKTTINYRIKKDIIDRNEEIELNLDRKNPQSFECGLIKVYLQIEKDGTIYSEDIVDVYEHVLYTHCFKHCGYYNVKIKKIRYYDIIGIFYKEEKINDSLDVYVFPNNIELANVSSFEKMSYLSNEYSTNKKGDDYSEIFDVHQYRENDQLKHIHWKISLKKNELFVKEGSYPIIKKTYLCLQQSKFNAENDYILDQFYSLCLSLYKDNEEFSILYANDIQDIFCIDDIRESIKRLLEYPQYDIDYSLLDDDFLLISEQGIEVVHL